MTATLHPSHIGTLCFARYSFLSPNGAVDPHMFSTPPLLYHYSVATTHNPPRIHYLSQVSFGGMTFDFADTGGLEDGADEPWKAPPGIGRKPRANNRYLDKQRKRSSLIAAVPQACMYFRVRSRFVGR